jgi:hypothetical protein
MQTAELNLKSLYLLSEDLAEDFAQQVSRAVEDCRQRPSLAKKREVHLRLIITPHPDDADDVLIHPVTTSKTPARQTDPVRARRTRLNQLQFDFDDGDL